MHKLAIQEAETRLGELINEVVTGEEVIITRGDGRRFRLVETEDSPRPRFGSARGLVRMSDDFDEPLEDFQDYAP